MAYPLVIRHHEGFRSYLVLDDRPRELLRHSGFPEEFSVRPWLGSLDPVDAREEWAEMLAEDPDNYLITDSEHRDYVIECSLWEHCKLP